MFIMKHKKGGELFSPPAINFLNTYSPSLTGDTLSGNKP